MANNNKINSSVKETDNAASGNNTDVIEKKVIRFDSKISDEDIAVANDSPQQQIIPTSTASSGSFWIWFLAFVLLIPSLYSISSTFSRNSRIISKRVNRVYIEKE
jgi:hypothetical protein